MCILVFYLRFLIVAFPPHERFCNNVLLRFSCCSPRTQYNIPIPSDPHFPFVDLSISVCNNPVWNEEEELARMSNYNSAFLYGCNCAEEVLKSIPTALNGGGTPVSYWDFVYCTVAKTY